jgi:hypothetical protein
MVSRFLPIFLVVLCTSSRAQDCTFPDTSTPVSSYEQTLALLRQGCLGDSTLDKNPIVVRFDAITNEPINLGETARLLKAVDVLSAVAEEHASGATLNSEWSKLVAELRDSRSQLATLGTVQTKAGWLNGVQRAIPAKWKLVSAGRAMPVKDGGSPLQALGSIGCTDRQACPEFQNQLDLVRVVNLMARLAILAEQQSLADQYAESQLSLAQWEAYRTKAHHQYIWEVWANGLRMGKDLCPEDAGTHMKIGFCKVPTSQLIILHPEAALRFSRTATSASQLNPAVVVELLGMYGWHWRSANGNESAEMEGRKGFSVAATYTNTNEEKRWGFGPMFHMGDYSLAITSVKGGRWSLVLNLGLADKYFGRKQEFISELQKVRKSSLAELLTNN